ncbi:HAD family hydrolase [Clostridium thailandense]|uniref:HAD family hydrolase n=1 Tax=Clostridium thailandense TaxID=2794346 RepID=UPI00398977AB
MIKLIATDLDGTLINDYGKINEKIFSLIELLNKKNIIFAAASGRFYSQLSKNFQKANSNMLFIAHNGALIKYNKSDKVLYSNCIRQEDIKKIASLKRDLGEELFLAGDDTAYIVNPSQIILDEFKNCEVIAEKVKSFDELKSPIYKMTYYVKDGVKPEMIEYLKSNINDNLEFVLSGDKWIDIANKGVSKGNAIRILQEKFNIDEKDTMVFGDYYNDLTMFKRAYYSYAMKNAPEDVKEYANFIAESNNDNGVYKVINEYAVSL